MKCVSCQNELEEINFRGITVAECPQCQGRWFDRGELQKAKESKIYAKWEIDKLSSLCGYVDSSLRTSASPRDLNTRARLWRRSGY